MADSPRDEAQLQATLNLIPAYTWYATLSGALTFVNERCADFLGLPKDHPLRFGAATDAAWDSHIPLLHPDDHEETRRVWSQCLTTGSPGEMSFRVRSGEGTYRWFISRAEPLRRNDGTILYWIGINFDIEERKQAERAVETSVDLLRTIADVLDIRSVFPRVSEIANKALPHDAMAIAFFEENGQIAVEAATPGFPQVKSSGSFKKELAQAIVDDLEAVPATASPDAVMQGQVLAAGYRSLLSIWTQARHQVMNVAFFSKRPRAFTRQDLPIARRIADHIVLAVSHEQLAEAARQAAEARARADRLEARVQMLTEELDSKTHGHVVGESTEWKDALKKAAQVATTDTTVLLTGESGTGKEVVARFIHRASGRTNGPFVALNCAALPEQLLESELFGYERGAFTSAQQSKPGQIELAAGGVLFLDEVSEMSLSAQAKFLRVLQEREFQRLGGTKMLKANVRVIAATNRDLRKAVELGNFRQDLFYRLQVFDIEIAPLRERRTDILPLSEAFLEEIGKSFGRPPAGLTREARQALLNYDWPGNVRELRNALERAAIVCEGGLIHGQHLALRAATKLATHEPTTNLNAFERETIARVLQETRWNKSKAAKRLGLTRTQLYGRMRKYGLDGPALDA